MIIEHTFYAGEFLTETCLDQLGKELPSHNLQSTAKTKDMHNIMIF